MKSPQAEAGCCCCKISVGGQAQAPPTPPPPLGSFTLRSKWRSPSMILRYGIPFPRGDRVKTCPPKNARRQCSHHTQPQPPAQLHS
eukprot:363142-Chlamydomonas_euryale.AAC.10